MDLPLVISADQLATELNNPNLLIIDLSSPENYQAGHIPGAISVAPSVLLRGSGDVPNKIPQASQLTQLFSSVGLSNTTHVIVYDDQMGPLAGRMIWTLHCTGHFNCSFLDGQLNSWKAAKLPLETQTNTPQPTDFQASINPDYLADVDYIKDHLNQTDHIVLDVRSEPEYRGEKIINAKKGGHIPGAVNYEWTRALMSGDDLKLRPADEIRAELAALGVTADKTLITHCQTHRRSGLSYLFTKHLGFEKVRCYDGSWFEWGNLEDTPVE